MIQIIDNGREHMINEMSCYEDNIDLKMFWHLHIKQ